MREWNHTEDIDARQVAPQSLRPRAQRGQRSGTNRRERTESVCGHSLPTPRHVQAQRLHARAILPRRQCAGSDQPKTYGLCQAEPHIPTLSPRPTSLCRRRLTRRRVFIDFELRSLAKQGDILGGYDSHVTVRLKLLCLALGFGADGLRTAPHLNWQPLRAKVMRNERCPASDLDHRLIVDQFVGCSLVKASRKRGV